MNPGPTTTIFKDHFCLIRGVVSQLSMYYSFLNVIGKLVELCQNCTATSYHKQLKNMITCFASNNFCTSGMAKAAVLPEPVRALASTSFPSRDRGMAFSWIGVGCVQPILAIACKQNKTKQNNKMCKESKSEHLKVWNMTDSSPLILLSSYEWNITRFPSQLNILSKSCHQDPFRWTK